MKTPNNKRVALRYINSGWKASGKRLIDPDGSTMSLPNLDRGDEQALVVGNNAGEEGKIYITRGEIYFDGYRYDKSFSSLKKLAKWLSKNKLEYYGFDDAY